MQKAVLKIDAGTMGRLMGYPWPGNIRELESVMERAVILSQGPNLEVEDQLLPLLDMSRQQMNSPTVLGHLSHKTASKEEKEHLLEEVLGQVGGNRSKAARLLGIGRTTVWRKLKAKQASCETNKYNETLESVS
jgi:transcriptional regulator with PAS, ATPase and Fis domain